MLATIDMRAKLSPFGSQLPVFGQRKHLKTAAIRKNGAIPTVKFMQSPCLLEDIKSRAEVEMIRITQNNLCTDVLLSLDRKSVV